MAGYTKLFSSILASTIWREDDKTRIVWITLLALADKHGIAECSLPGLADLARVSISDCEQALIKLMSPDTYSRTKEFEGRRVRVIDGGWQLLNHAKYRAKLSAEDRREYLRLKKQESRARLAQSTDSQQSIDLSHMSTHTEAEAEATTDTEAGMMIFSELQGKLNSMFRRNAMAPWSYAEQSALSEITRRPGASEEFAELEAFSRKRDAYFPQSLSSLLAKWNETLDRSRGSGLPGKPVLSGPKRAQVTEYAKEKWGDDDRHTNWAISFHSWWSDPSRTWQRNGKLIDWQDEFTKQVMKWRE